MAFVRLEATTLFRERVVSGEVGGAGASIFHSGEYWPNRHVTVSLIPDSPPNRGSGFDLRRGEWAYQRRSSYDVDRGQEPKARGMC
jgi:hypothetical protein